jgi:hypothetical protein
MGGGQAGAPAPADDDHVPWSRTPCMATVTLPVTALAGQDTGTGAGLDPDPARKANRAGQGRSRQGRRRG